MYIQQIHIYLLYNITVGIGHVTSDDIVILMLFVICKFDDD